MNTDYRQRVFRGFARIYPKSVAGPDFTYTLTSNPVIFAVGDRDEGG